MFNILRCVFIVKRLNAEYNDSPQNKSLFTSVHKQIKGNINHWYTYQRVSTCYILKLQKNFFFL